MINISNWSKNLKWTNGQGSLLAVAEVDIGYPGYIVCQKGLQSFSEMNSIKSDEGNMQVSKLIVHPGEINSFKCWPLNRRIIASHSDHPEIYIWDINLQP